MRIILMLTALVGLFFWTCDFFKAENPAGPVAIDTLGTDTGEVILVKPTGLVCAFVNDSQVLVTWTRVALADSYAVTVNNGPVQRTTVVTDTHALIDTLRLQQTYWIGVAALKGTQTAHADTTLCIEFYRFGQPDSLRVTARTATSVSVAWCRRDDFRGVMGYRAYLFDYTGSRLDSVDTDTLSLSATFSGLEVQHAYKISVATRTQLGTGALDSVCRYDTSSLDEEISHYNNFRLPCIYVSTYTIPGDFSSPLAGDFKGVQGGLFSMGPIWTDAMGDFGASEKPVHEVLLSSFLMGVHEVTIEQYCTFLTQADITWLLNTIDLAGGGQDTFFYFLAGGDTLGHTDYSSWHARVDLVDSSVTPESGFENFPQVCLTWIGAARYCNWLSQQEGLTPCFVPADWSVDVEASGYRLATDAEFEYVASGAFSGHKMRFPWGYLWQECPVDPIPVEMREVGTTFNSFGFFDIIGNVQEYLCDWSDVPDGEGSPYYRECSTQGVVVNPTGPASGTVRLMRSGSYEFGASQQAWQGYVSTYRYYGACATLSDYGMRLVRSVR